MKNRIFIASSSHGLPFARAIKKKLESENSHYTAHIWEDDDHNGEMILQTVLREINSAHCVVVLLTHDDELSGPVPPVFSASGSVLIELGLSLGVSKQERTILVQAKSAKATLKLPTDILGCKIVYFDENNGPESAAETVCPRLSDYIAPLRARRKTVAFPLNYNSEFHREVLEGFRHCVEKDEFVILDRDTYPSLHHGEATRFPAAFRIAEDLEPDFIVVIPPGRFEKNHGEFVSALTQATKRGRSVIIIENEPVIIENEPKAFDGMDGRAFVIRSQSEDGAEKLGAHVRAGGFKQIWILPGPVSSDNAERRMDALRASMNGENYRMLDPVQDWSRGEAQWRIRRHFEEPKSTPLAIICGNDEMALGAADAIFEYSKQSNSPPHDFSVFGYDGSLEVVCAIAQGWSPIKGTVWIPTQAYGERAYREAAECVRKGRFSRPRDIIRLETGCVLNRRSAIERIEKAKWANLLK